MDDERPAYERVVTGVPRWLLSAYLEDLGARRRGDGRLEGDGWWAELAQIEDHQIGSLRVGRVRARLFGADERLAPIRQAFERRLIRGGG